MSQTSSFDLNDDGVAEQVGMDTDADGAIDQWFTDTTGDGVVDEAAVDIDGDGAADLWLSDADHDGLTDVAVTDQDRDGHYEMVPGVPLDPQSPPGIAISFDSDGGTGLSNPAPSEAGGGGSVPFTSYFPDSTSYDDPDGDGSTNIFDADYGRFDSVSGDTDMDGEPDFFDQNPTMPEPYEGAD